jgi:hypothetical protein
MPVVPAVAEVVAVVMPVVPAAAGVGPGPSGLSC